MLTVQAATLLLCQDWASVNDDMAGSFMCQRCVVKEYDI